MDILEKWSVFWLVFDGSSNFLFLKISRLIVKQLLFYACFHFDQILHNKIFVWKSRIFQVLLHKQKTKVNFSQKARFLGFHWALSRMPYGYGYVYQKIPSPSLNQFMEVTPLQDRAVREIWVRSCLSHTYTDYYRYPLFKDRFLKMAVDGAVSSAVQPANIQTGWVPLGLYSCSAVDGIKVPGELEGRFSYWLPSFT